MTLINAYDNKYEKEFLKEHAEILVVDGKFKHLHKLEVNNLRKKRLKAAKLRYLRGECANPHTKVLTTQIDKFYLYGKDITDNSNLNHVNRVLKADLGYETPGEKKRRLLMDKILIRINSQRNQLREFSSDETKSDENPL